MCKKLSVKKLAGYLAVQPPSSTIVCPAYVKTPLVEKQIAAQAKENNLTEEEVITKIMLEPMPKKQFVSVDELADTASFLMSPSARNITGQTMVLDGGWTAR